MKTRISKSVAWLIICLLPAFYLQAQEKEHQFTLKEVAGTWTGKLKIQNLNLKLDLNITPGENDSLIATLDSPDQGILDIPTDRLYIEEDSLIVSAHGIGGKLTGLISQGADTLFAKWHQGGSSFPLIMIRQGQRTMLNRPQEPKPPYPYRVTEVTFQNPEGKFDLAGTLTMPEKPGLYPAVVLITGSGPQNRDEETLGHKPFLVIADFLTRHGYAVLRYDDRGTGDSKGDLSIATTLDLATDASAAVDFLRTRPEIDTSRIGLIGHSEGGIIAPMVASVRKDIHFIILLAGPGLPGEQILLLQAALISKAGGASDEKIRSNDKFSKDIYTAVKKNSDNAKAEKRIRSLFEAFNKEHKGDTNYRQFSQQEIDLQLKTLTSSWYRTFLTLNPETYLVKVKCPLLAMNGSLDLQVPPKENLQAIEKALIFGGNSDYVMEEMDGLNHLFQTAKTGSPDEYAKIEETFSPVALDLILRWMQNHNAN